MDGYAHWCGRSFPNGPPETYCAILPPRSAHQHHAPTPPSAGVSIDLRRRLTPRLVCVFPPVGSRLCYLFRNRALMGKSVIDDPARQIIRAPLVMGLAVEHARMHFGLALLRADAPALAA